MDNTLRAWVAFTFIAQGCALAHERPMDADVRVAWHVTSTHRFVSAYPTAGFISSLYAGTSNAVWPDSGDPWLANITTRHHEESLGNEMGFAAVSGDIVVADDLIIRAHAESRDGSGPAAAVFGFSLPTICVTSVGARSVRFDVQCAADRYSHSARADAYAMVESTTSAGWLPVCAAGGSNTLNGGFERSADSWSTVARADAHGTACFGQEAVFAVSAGFNADDSDLTAAAMIDGSITIHATPMF